MTDAFRSFVSLLHEISKIKPRRAGASPSKPTSGPPKVVQILDRWIAELHRKFSPLPPDTMMHFFRLFFPEEDVRRKYELQETRLARHLADIFSVSTSSNSRGTRLRDWKSEKTLGCLGNEVRTVLEASSPVSIFGSTPATGALSSCHLGCRWADRLSVHSSSGSSSG